MSNGFFDPPFAQAVGRKPIDPPYELLKVSMIKNSLAPNWSVPQNIHAFTTTRATQINGKNGVSVAPFDAFNLATHVGDDAQAVAHNRALLREIVPNEPLWLNQTHGVAVFKQPLSPTPLPEGARGFDNTITCNGTPEADAVLITEPNQVAVIMTADCLPVLFTTRQGNMVAGAHAGWRSLVGGVLENTVQAMCDAGAQRTDILAWMGPAIGAEQFDVGAQVRAEFIEVGIKLGISEHTTNPCFQAKLDNKYTADIYELARLRLQFAGITAQHISGGGLCTVSDPQQFYSYRREGKTGRMASLIWFEENE